MFDIGAGVVTWDEWLHYAGTYDKATARGTLHINGMAVQSANVTAGAEIAGDWNQGARVGRNIDNARPFTGLMDEFCLFTRALSEAEIQVLMEGIRLTPAELASEPDPAHEANDVSVETALSWKPGAYAAAHDVYVGTVLDDVNNAGRAAPLVRRNLARRRKAPHSGRWGAGTSRSAAAGRRSAVSGGLPPPAVVCGVVGPWNPRAVAPS